MPNDRTRSGDPASDIPEAAGAYRPPFPQQEPGTLAGRLVNVVDTCRNIKAMLGVSIYRVFLVHGYWTGAGGRRGRGAGKLVITSRVEIVPIPRVRDLNAVRRVANPMGTTEEGDIIVDQISARYTEDDLTGKTPDLIDPGTPRTDRRSMVFWYEVQENRPSSPVPPPRRFSPPTATPMLTRGGLQWTVVLTKQGYDAGRTGDVDDARAE